MSAHHLVIPALVALLLLVWTRFLATRIGLFAALVAAASLALLPRFFAHGLSNLKDAPEACLYTIAAVFAYLGLTRRQLRWWVLGGVFTAMALAHRPNALFLPVQMLVYLVLALLATRADDPDRPRFTVRGFLIGLATFCVTYYAVSPPYWVHPVEGPMEVIGQMRGAATRGGADSIWAEVSLYGPIEVLRTTPLPVLVLALIGLFASGISRGLRLFLLVGILVPLARTMIPGMRTYNGVRHILEIFPPLCAFAGIGLVAVVQRVSSLLPKTPEGLVRAACGLGALVPSLYADVRMHPNQIVYFNATVGGLPGMQARWPFVVHDYWLNGYWQGIAWLSASADPGSVVVVPSYDHVARAAAPVRLREDLEIWSPETEIEGRTLYALLPYRSSTPFESELEETREPVLDVRAQGGSVLRIFRMDDDAESRAPFDTFLGRQEERLEEKPVIAFLKRHPEGRLEAFRLSQELREGRVELDAAVATLLTYLPEERRTEDEDPLRRWLSQFVPRAPED